MQKNIPPKSSVWDTPIGAVLSGHPLGPLRLWDGCSSSGNEVFYFVRDPLATPRSPVTPQGPPSISWTAEWSAHPPTQAQANQQQLPQQITISISRIGRSVNSNFVTWLPEGEDEGPCYASPKDRWLATVSTNSFAHAPPSIWRGRRVAKTNNNDGKSISLSRLPEAQQHQPQSKSLYCNASLLFHVGYTVKKMIVYQLYAKG